MTTDLKSIAILIPGRLHPHAVARLEDRFQIVRSDRPAGDAVSSQHAAQIRGIAAMTRIDA
jgi:hypothetical protein